MLAVTKFSVLGSIHKKYQTLTPTKYYSPWIESSNPSSPGTHLKKTIKLEIYYSAGKFFEGFNFHRWSIFTISWVQFSHMHALMPTMNCTIELISGVEFLWLFSHLWKWWKLDPLKISRSTVYKIILPHLNLLHTLDQLPWKRTIIPLPYLIWYNVWISILKNMRFSGKGRQ